MVIIRWAILIIIFITMGVASFVLGTQIERAFQYGITQDALDRANEYESRVTELESRPLFDEDKVKWEYYRGLYDACVGIYLAVVNGDKAGIQDIIAQCIKITNRSIEADVYAIDSPGYEAVYGDSY